jgi:hypothetical protein
MLPDRPHPSTLWRWSARGIKGIKLETTLVGGRRYVSLEALARFFERLNSSNSHVATTPDQPERNLERIERELDAAGL